VVCRVSSHAWTVILSNMVPCSFASVGAVVRSVCATTARAGGKLGSFEAEIWNFCSTSFAQSRARRLRWDFSCATVRTRETRFNASVEINAQTNCKSCVARVARCAGNAQYSDWRYKACASSPHVTAGRLGNQPLGKPERGAATRWKCHRWVMFEDQAT